jgi:hypothetical protein
MRVTWQDVFFAEKVGQKNFGGNMKGNKGIPLLPVVLGLQDAISAF